MTNIEEDNGCILLVIRAIGLRRARSIDTCRIRNADGDGNRSPCRDGTPTADGDPFRAAACAA
jgi:hypothetical protein